jgi:hypothetical protein
LDGRSVAPARSPRRFLASAAHCCGRRTVIQSSEAGFSKRPFAPHERLPVSGPPLADRSSRPASSNARRRVLQGSFGSGLRSSLRSRRRGGSSPFARYLRSCAAVPASSRILLPFRTEVHPAHRSFRFVTGKLAIANVRSPYTPRKFLLVISGSSLQVRFVSPDSLFRATFK